MVPRNKDELTPPPALMDPKWDSLKLNLLLEKHSHEAKPECYGQTTRESLCDLYKNKCAFCERSRGTELQVDHYRPKKARNNNTNQHYNQPGYYWLCYEWSNLIPLCSRCNQIKSNKFPLMVWSEVNRISDHLNANSLPTFLPYDLKWLQGHEKPFLINPEYEKNPEKHFIFKSDGTIDGRTEQGVETINICGLNRRDLRRERLELRQIYVNEIKEAFDDFSNNKDESELRGALKSTFKRIKISTDPDAPHSLFHVFIYKYFDYFIGRKLPISIRDKAIKYFQDFIK